MLMVMVTHNQLLVVEFMVNILKLITSILTLVETDQSTVRFTRELCLEEQFKLEVLAQEALRRHQSKWSEDQFHQGLQLADTLNQNLK